VPLARPDLGSVAEDLYARLEPFHRHSYGDREISDEELGWPLLTYWGLIARLCQEIDDLVRDSDEGAGYTSLMDPDRIKPEGLPWLGQLIGVRMLPNMTTQQQKDRIAGTDGFKRGSSAAVAVATQLHLTGDKNVIINEMLGGNPYRIGVVTWADETPDPAQTELDIEEQLPWWITLEYNVEGAWGYLPLRTAFDDYEAILLHFTSTGYQGILEEDPPV
jgi:hypothetical protein